MHNRWGHLIMKIHIIENNIVTNTIEAESVGFAQELFPQATCVKGSTGGIGWNYLNGIFSPPPEPTPAIPTTVSMRQARLTLLAAGLLDAVNAAIAAMPGVDGDAARIEWEYATEVRRDSPLVSSLGPALGLDDAALDALFLAAAAAVPV